MGEGQSGSGPCCGRHAGRSTVSFLPPCLPFVFPLGSQANLTRRFFLIGKNVSFTLSTRPFDAVLKLLASPAHLAHSPSSAKFTRSYLLSHLRHPLHPSHRPQRFRTANLTQPLPAIPLIAKTAKTRGVGWFFRTPTNERVSGGWGRRLAWGALRVGPWGAGFLMFAWVGGEV